MIELRKLFRAMEDDRDRWLAEANQQADGLAGYFTHFLGIDSEKRPWTFEMIRCGLAIGNLVYMYYKAHFKRVRPSLICPGLVPPFGPPRHPSFPSGHSFLGHFIAMLLMEIPEIAQRFGEDNDPPNTPLPSDVRARTGLKPSITAVMKVDVIFGGPLMWFADRLARNRERIGVHYPSDSAFSRMLAAAICQLLVTDAGTSVLDTNSPPVRHWPDLDNRATPPQRTNALGYMKPAELIHCPTLRHVRRMARSEWATN